MSKRLRKYWGRILLLSALMGLAWMFVTSASPQEAQHDTGPSPAQTSPVFTPAHRGMLDAVKDFFNWREEPVQPIAYTHKVHLENGMECTDCHTGVETGPVAGIPGVQACMMCHEVIATEKPEIKKLAGYFERGEDIPWQRVYDYSPTAHVKFNHAPHIRAGVDCSQCHGDMTQQTVAVRTVDLTMGACIDCHKQEQASIDCTVCHY